VMGVALLAIPLGVAGLLLFVVGIVPATMWATLAFASLYEAITLRVERPAAPVTDFPAATGHP